MKKTKPIVKKVKKQSSFTQEPISNKDIKRLIKQLEKARKQKTKKEKPKTKAKPKKEKTKIKNSIDQIAKLDYQRSVQYQQKSLDYNKIFSYLGNANSTNSYDAYLATAKEEKEDAIITYQELETVIKREHINILIRNSGDIQDVKVREKYKHWKDCNRFMNMIMLQLNQVGEGATNAIYLS